MINRVDPKFAPCGPCPLTCSVKLRPVVVTMCSSRHIDTAICNNDLRLALKYAITAKNWSNRSCAAMATRHTETTCDQRS